MPAKKNKLSTIHNAHDNFFVQSLSDLTIAKDFLQQHLPQPLLEALDLSSLQIDKERFVDADLRSRYADVVFKLHLINSTQTAYIITHIEHQSKPQEDMPVRVLLYQSGIIKHHWYNYHQINYSRHPEELATRDLLNVALLMSATSRRSLASLGMTP